ncbi:MAG: hypothetical protein NVSMB19_22220 [Vulcanimicrobiaceae bacterium]
MRSFFARLALIGTVGAALVGCGTTSESSLPIGAFPNASGGGPTNVSNQPPPAGAVASKLIDGGLLTVDGAYTGVNTTATDTQSALENGTDTVNAAARPPADPAAGTPPGSHAINFSGNGLQQLEFLFNNKVPIDLTYTSGLPGQIQPATYGAIVLFAYRTPGAIPAVPPPATPTINIELTGGAGSTAFDTRIACAAKSGTPATPAPGTPPPTFTRFVCALPAYGASVSQPTENPVSPSATSGTFTPTNVKLYVVLQFATGTNPASINNILGLDTIYAEQGVN